MLITSASLGGSPATWVNVLTSVCLRVLFGPILGFVGVGSLKSLRALTCSALSYCWGEGIPMEWHVAAGKLCQHFGVGKTAKVKFCFFPNPWKRGAVTRVLSGRAGLEGLLQARSVSASCSYDLCHTLTIKLLFSPMSSLHKIEKRVL